MSSHTGSVSSPRPLSEPIDNSIKESIDQLIITSEILTATMGSGVGGQFKPLFIYLFYCKFFNVIFLMVMTLIFFLASAASQEHSYSSWCLVQKLSLPFLRISTKLTRGRRNFSEFFPPKNPKFIQPIFRFIYRFSILSFYAGKKSDKKSEKSRRRWRKSGEISSTWINFVESCRKAAKYLHQGSDAAPAEAEKKRTSLRRSLMMIWDSVR